MTWIYHQATGELTHNDSSFQGYSGTGDGRDNPAMDDVRGIGPIPKGNYTIGDAFDDSHLGPCVMALTPNDVTDTHGRSGFFIHGNNVANDASHGCVIMPPMTRNLISTSGDNSLMVV